MKTAKEYRALAWGDLRAQFKQSSIIIFFVMVIALIAVSALVGAAAVAVMQESLIGWMMFAGVLLAIIFGVSVLDFYQPVWFLNLIRDREAPWYETKVGYARALGVALLMLIPTVLSESVDGLSKILDHMHDAHWSVLLIVALAILVLAVASLVFTFWWAYAVSAVLPYRVYDHEDRSVIQSLKDSIRMMDGYKWKLFCVDFLIYIWPLVVLFVLLGVVIILSVLVAFAHATSAIMTVGYVLTGALLTVTLLVYTFMVKPMIYFARARFYEDLKAELEAPEEEVIEEVKSEE
jgi:uncharacterized membrane protein